MQKHLAFLAIAASATAVTAEETRHLDAHEHGVGELNIAFEGDTIAMEFHAPGFDIVGFEYEATTEDDKIKIKNALAALEDPSPLFVWPDAAGCIVTHAHASLIEEDHDDHEGHDDHDDHDGHDDEHAHDDDDHGHKDEDHAADKDDHGHDDDHDHGHDDDHAEGEASHTEFHAEYELTCENTAAIDQINFAYFELFEGAKEVEVQIASSKGAQAFEVERDEPILDLRGVF